MLEVSNDTIDIASSDDEDDVGNSVSENVDSTSENLDNRNVEICSSEEEVSESYVTRFAFPNVFLVSNYHRETIDNLTIFAVFSHLFKQP